MKHPAFLVSSLRMALGVLVSSGMMAVSAGAATFSDAGAFSTSTWSETIHGNGSVVDTRLTFGGNPGENLSLQTIPNGGTIVIGFYLNGAAAWDPSTQGAIATVDMDLDVTMFASAFGHPDGQAYGIALVQNGNIFQSGYKTIGYPLSTWESRSIPGISGPGFIRVNPDGTKADPSTDPFSHPDFSVSGSVINFGLVVANSGGNPISGTTAGYDNWALTVTPVPEPASFVLFTLGLAGVGLVARRRRRH